MKLADLKECTTWQQEIVILLELILRELRTINETDKEIDNG